MIKERKREPTGVKGGRSACDRTSNTGMIWQVQVYSSSSPKRQKGCKGLWGMVPPVSGQNWPLVSFFSYFNKKYIWFGGHCGACLYSQHLGGWGRRIMSWRVAWTAYTLSQCCLNIFCLPWFELLTFLLILPLSLLFLLPFLIFKLPILPFFCYSPLPSHLKYYTLFFLKLFAAIL
jgi:hypothetical protein